MNAPPAFQFYPDDFLGGVADMTQAEVGAYILLLCQQWNRGSIPVQPDRQKLLAKGDVSEHVLSKFKEGKDGLLINERLESERDKQAKFREAQKVKGQKSGKSRRTPVEPRLNSGSHPVGTGRQPEGNSPSPSPSPLAVREYAERPSLQEVTGYGSIIGLAEWKATDFFQEMEGCGWRDHAGREIDKWQRVLDRVKTKWESDGRPTGPPKNEKHSGTNRQGADRNAGTANAKRIGQYDGVGKVV